MRAMAALIRREYLEHRGAYLYAPAALLAVTAAAILYWLLTFDAAEQGSPFRFRGVFLYQLALVYVFYLWTIYVVIALFFYYADSFSADRRNNALLFWKSMPQSDLRVLTSKALSGITVFPGLIMGFAMVAAVLVYVGLLLASARIGIIEAPAPLDALWSFVQMSVVGAIYILVSILWAAPFLAWVGGLSTLFRRWSIPLAVAIPAAVVLFESLNNAGGLGNGRPIAAFLLWRLEGLVDEDEAFRALVGTGRGDGGPGALLRMIVDTINWLHLGLGLLFTVAVVYLASEYRRRRIEA